MRKAHVKVFPLGAIVFVLVLLGGVFPSMAQAVNLTINFEGSGPGGKVEGSPPPPDIEDPFFTVLNSSLKTVTIPYDEEPSSPVILTAIGTGQNADQSIFAGWSGCPSPSGNQCTVALNTDQTVTVTFNLVPVTPPVTPPVNLTVNFAGTGTGQVAGSGAGTAPFTIFNSGTIPYDLVQPPSSVTLIATPTGLGASLSTFAGWSGGGCTGTGSCIVTMTAAQAVTATFTTVQRTLTVTKAGTGSGTVTSVPGGIACGNDCTGGYANGTAVTLTAVASAGSTFTGWSGGGCTGTALVS